MKKSTENKKNNVKEPTASPNERRGNREAVKIADKISRIQQELLDIRIRMYHWYINAHEKEDHKKLLNSEKKRRVDRELMLEHELAKANEQLKLKAELEQSDDC